jgi:hypothetical protein
MEVDMDPSVLGSGDCFLGTGVHTPLTVQAVVAVVHDLHSGELGLRIGAPFAAKGTSLQEDGGPHAGTVMDGKLLNIKNNAFYFHLEKLLISTGGVIRHLGWFIMFLS